MRELVSTHFVGKALVAARVALPLGLVALALAPAGARGAADVIRNSGNNFEEPTYYSDQGDLVQFEHTGGSPHDVVSTQSLDGSPFFESALISSGTTPVNGTELLAPGSYPFVCTIHTGMNAELVVRSVEPPPAEPPPAEPPPGSDAPDTKADKATIKKVEVVGLARVKKGKKATYKVRITNSGNVRANGVKLKVKRKGAKAKKSVGSIAAGKTSTVKVRLRFKKPGRVKAAFKVTSKNAGGKTVKKRIRVRK